MTEIAETFCHPRHPRGASRARAVLAMTVMLATLVTLAGCNVVGVLGGAIAPEQKVNVKAAYLGLVDQTIAVLVSADDQVLYEYPGSIGYVRRSISKKIDGFVTGSQLLPDKQMQAFTDRHPYWLTMPYSELVDKLGVTRVVMVDLIDYRTHEPGNREVWRGVINANVNVIEGDAANPNLPAYTTVVNTVYPEDTAVGLLKSNDQTIQRETVGAFSSSVANLFRNYETMR